MRELPCATPSCVVPSWRCRIRARERLEVTDDPRTPPPLPPVRPRTRGARRSAQRDQHRRHRRDTDHDRRWRRASVTGCGTLDSRFVRVTDGRDHERPNRFGAGRGPRVGRRWVPRPPHPPPTHSSAPLPLPRSSSTDRAETVSSGSGTVLNMRLTGPTTMPRPTPSPL